VLNTLIQFSATEAAAESGGIAALGLDVKSFIFQLITFVLVVLLLRKFAWGKLVNTLEERRKAVESSINQAAEAAKELASAEQKVAVMIKDARKEAEGIIAMAHKESVAMHEDAEAKALRRADHIVSEARAQLDQDVLKAREALKDETKQLVAQATEKILKEKIDVQKDGKLIESALKESR
jgi:F-type H+-transporting ATPase subunit b